MQGKIICAFFGTGKTYVNQTKAGYIDLETYYFAERKDLLINAIKDITEKYNLNVLIVCTKEIIELLQENDLDFICVLPSKDLKEEYHERYKTRGNEEAIVKGLTDNFEKNIDEVMATNCKKVILKSGEYLNDILEEVV